MSLNPFAKKEPPQPHSFQQRPSERPVQRMEPAIMEVDHFSPPRARRAAMSEVAARAAQQQDDLMTELERLQGDLNLLLADKRVLEQSVIILQEERDHLVVTNERLIRENTILHTRIGAAADVLVGLKRPIEPIEPTESTQSSEAEAPKVAVEVVSS